MKNNLIDYEEFKKQTYQNERIEQIITFILSNDPKLQEMIDKSSEIFNELMNKLNDEDIDLLFEYEKIETAIETYENYKIASQIYKDLEK